MLVLNLLISLSNGLKYNRRLEEINRYVKTIGLERILMIFVDFGVMESLLSNHAKNGEGT